MHARDEETNCEQNLVKLAPPQAAQELIKHSLLAAENESEMMQIEEEISHYSHRHPLTLCSINSHTQQYEARIIGKEIIICDCCIEPVYHTEVYYSCVDCGYFIHATCARLPLQIQILNHPDHPLFLAVEKLFVGHFICKACSRFSNGLFYECQPCELRVCIKCISVALTKNVVHSAHDKHPLTNPAKNSCNDNCSACGFGINQGFGFGCDKCRFYLCSECAILPTSTKQRWYDDHPLLLIYEAYYEHPDDFYCAMCEEEINPNCWMYHCRIRDNSFHVWCIPQIRLFRNLKFGRTLRVDNHPHPLTHVPEAKYKSFCGVCNKRLDWEQAFECDDPCKFYLCLGCAEERELPTDDDDSPQSDEGEELMPPDHAEQHETTASLRWRTLKQKLIISRRVVKHFSQMASAAK